MTRPHSGKRRAVRNTLVRLGLQARPAEVCAALARYGVAVSPDLVRQVQRELLDERFRAERDARQRQQPDRRRTDRRRPPRRNPGTGR
jgi:hypothetical protein